jgi:hypothetical protein
MASSEPRTVRQARTDAQVTLQTDGKWCPMAHCNRTDDSFQDLPPLRAVTHFQKITDPRISQRGFIHLGSFTGQKMAVCTYSSPRHPALVAYEYQSGSIVWTSPLEDLPGFPRRIPAGILITAMRVGASAPRTRVFAANPAEFVAYTSEGLPVWKRRSNEVVADAPHGIGLPISLSFTDRGEIVAATTGGWIIKLSPYDGQTIDAYKMTANLSVGNRLYRGTFFTCKSPIVIGNVLYLLAEFRAHPSTPLRQLLSPVHILRIELSQPGLRGKEHKIKPLSQVATPQDLGPDRVVVGLNRGRGSPPAWVAPDGRVLIFAHAHTLRDGRMLPTIAGVEDCAGKLTLRWISALDALPGESVHSAPALHGPSGSLFVTTPRSIFLFRNIDSLSGIVPSPQPLACEDMVAFAARPAIRRVAVGSPFALTFDREREEIVAYTNFCALPRGGLRKHGFLGAFAVPVRRNGSPYPLWNSPLAVTRDGCPGLGPGTVGQAALFRYMNSRGEATGLIVNTVFTGTYVLK